MLNGLKISFAINQVLADLVTQGLLSSQTADLANRIAGSKTNHAYGVEGLDRKAAKCRYSATAVMFARLAMTTARKPAGGIQSDQWKLACAQSFRRAGSDAADIDAAVEGLFEMLSRIDARAGK